MGKRSFNQVKFCSIDSLKYTRKEKRKVHEMKIPGWLKWALRQALGTDRGNKAITHIEGPIGGLLDAVVLRGRGAEELSRLEAQAQRFLDDINEVIR